LGEAPINVKNASSIEHGTGAMQIRMGQKMEIKSGTNQENAGNLVVVLPENGKGMLPPSLVKPPVQKKAEEGRLKQFEGGLNFRAPPGAMSCICLNCHRLSSDVSVGDLHDLVMRFKPTVLCVVETQLQKLRVKGLARTLGFDHFL
jgi:hypothetical protein